MEEDPKFFEEDPVELMEEEPQYHPLDDDDDNSPDVRIGAYASSSDAPSGNGDGHHGLPNRYH